MLCSIIDQWMSGTWYGPQGPPAPVIKDINGVPLTVGDAVSLTGIIASIQPSSLTTGNITVALDHPFPGSISVTNTSLMAKK
jgi:hypothetical protein